MTNDPIAIANSATAHESTGHSAQARLVSTFNAIGEPVGG